MTPSPNRKWFSFNDRPPSQSDLPITVVRSVTNPDKRIWTPYIEELTDEDKASVDPFFDHGETVSAEDWFPPPS